MSDINLDIVVPEITTLDSINHRIKNNANLSEQEIVTLLESSYFTILSSDYINNREYRQEVIDAFGNPIFLSALIKALKGKDLTIEQRVCCNKITWDYKSQKKQNDQIRGLLLDLSNTVNNTLIRLMCSIVPTNVAQLLALARFSSFNLEKCVKRVDYILIKCCMLSVQDIIDLFGYLYSGTSFAKVFNATMFDSNITGYTASEREQYGRISLAILRIVDMAFTSADIKRILLDYAQCVIEEKNKPRFSLWSISPDDYPRLYKNLLGMDGIAIP